MKRLIYFLIKEGWVWAEELEVRASGGGSTRREHSRPSQLVQQRIEVRVWHYALPRLES